MCYFSLGAQNDQGRSPSTFILAGISVWAKDVSINRAAKTSVTRYHIRKATLFLYASLVGR